MTEALDLKLRQIIAAEADCKRLETCQRLKIRELYFEPNDGTLERWRKDHGFYLDGIDRRLMFICESPSDRQHRTVPPHFEVNGQPGWTCWNLTSQDARFREMRMKYGLQNCVITNAVKCGLQRPSTPANLTDVEIASCAGFLLQEIEAIHPQVVVCVGDVAHLIVRKHIVPTLSYAAPVIKITHYSHRCSNEDLRSRWEQELADVRRHLDLGSSPEEMPWQPVLRQPQSDSAPSSKRASQSIPAASQSLGAWILRPYPHRMNRFNEFLCESMETYSAEVAAETMCSR